MRIARQPGSNNKKNMRGFALFFVLLLITPLTILRAEEPAGPSEVSTVDIEVTSQAVVINLAISEPSGVRSFNLTSPGRIVFDIENAVLALDNEAVTLWESPMDGIVDLTIMQFSLDPPVVRIVAGISDPVLQSDRMSTLDTISLAVYAGESPFSEDIGPGAPPEQLKPIIERFWHESTEADEDRFVIEFSFGVVLPQVRIESPTVLLLRFPGADVLLPASSPDNFATSVSGILVQRMRAERHFENGEIVTEIRLTVPNTNVLSYTLSTFSDDSIELIMFAEEIPEPVIEPVPEELEIVEREPTPVPIEGGEIMVLASSDDIPVMPDAPIRITRVQFQTLDSETDRYYIYFEGGNLEPHIQRFNYPTRVALYFPDAAVVLPESAAGRFQVAVHGAVTDELKVFNRVIEDSGPESQFIFYFPGYDQENIGFSVDYVETGLMHIDFYRTAVPIDIEAPVEVNLSIDQPAPAPEVTEEPEMIEGPVVLELTESTLPPEIPQSDTPLIIVASGEVVDGVVKFRINTTEQSSLPQWVEYHYPDRLGLRFPYADVQLLEAAPGICSSYTHIRAVPLVRAIMKDRDDEQHTTITFTLEGSIEDYFRNVEETGSGYLVTFSYNPIPAGHEIIEEPVTPEIVEPVLVEEPVEAVEPIAIPEPVIEEPELIEPVLVSEPELPVITVASGEEVDGVIKFRINITEPLPMPQWVEYHYPDRLGLRFPYADVQLLDAAPGVYSRYTHIKDVPLVRAIIKDRDGEQHTTVVWTLKGKIDEYSVGIEQEGTSYIVTFNYTPGQVPEPVVEEPMIIEPAPPVITEPEAELIAEEPEVEVPGIPVAPEVPPFQEPEPGVRPMITVTGGTVTGNRITFNITTSVLMPIPEWVEYRYPDRLGLLFPIADVSLLGDEDAFTVNTNIEMVPMIRAIVKDRPNEQNTTITFTLMGSLDEYNGEIEWDGQNIQVIFNYEPIVPEEPVVEPEIPMVTTEPEIVEVEIEVEVEVVEEEVEVEEVQDIRIIEVDIDKPEAGEFEGISITGIDFETGDSGDIIRLTADSCIGDWEITPANFPSKLVVKIPNSRPIFTNGDLARYDIRVDGEVVTQFVANATVSQDVSYTILMIYAHNTETAQMLDYEVQSDPDGMAIAVFMKGAESPLEETDHFVMAEDLEPERVGEEPEARILDHLPEPTAVREVEGLDELEEVEIEEGEVEDGPKISMRLEDADIRSVLQMIAEETAMDIMITESVQGTVTISLTDIPRDELLELLGDQHGFTFFIRNGVYIFGNPQKLQADFGELFKKWYVELSYADPDQVRSIITGMGILNTTQVVIYRGQGGVVGYIATPVMILYGERRDLERAYQVIASIDQPPVMIQIHFQILNTSLTDNRNFGFNINAGTGTGETNLLFRESGSMNPNLGPFPQGLQRTEPAYVINVAINYLLEEGYAELVNSSTLTVANNQNGNLFIGENIPYRSTYQVSELGRVTQRVSTQSVGLTLNFRPHANPDGTVTINLSPSNSNLLELTDIGPRTVDQNFTTTVRVNDGEPFIIGGFIRNEERVNYDRFPFLSELPLLGHLFRNRQVMKSKSELIFVCTPTIIYPSRHPLKVWTDDEFAGPMPFDERPY